MQDPYLSGATKKARATEAARSARIKWLFAGVAVFIVLLLGGVFYVAFSGGPKSSPASVEDERKELDAINDYLDSMNKGIADPKVPAANKKLLLSSKEGWEKRKLELLGKHPDWK